MKRQNILYSSVISKEVSSFAENISNDKIEIMKATEYSAVS